MFFSDFEDFADALGEDLLDEVEDSIERCNSYAYSTGADLPELREAIHYVVDNLNPELIADQILFEWGDERGCSDWPRLDDHFDSLIHNAPSAFSPQVSDIVNPHHVLWDHILRRADHFDADDIANW